MLLHPTYIAQIRLANFAVRDVEEMEREARETLKKLKQKGANANETRAKNKAARDSYNEKIKGSKRGKYVTSADGEMVYGDAPPVKLPDESPAARQERLLKRRAGQTEARNQRLGMVRTADRYIFDESQEKFNSPESKRIRRALAITEGRVQASPDEIKQAQTLLQNSPDEVLRVKSVAGSLGTATARGRSQGNKKLPAKKPAAMRRLETTQPDVDASAANARAKVRPQQVPSPSVDIDLESAVVGTDMPPKQKGPGLLRRGQEFFQGQQQKLAQRGADRAKANGALSGAVERGMQARIAALTKQVEAGDLSAVDELARLQEVGPPRSITDVKRVTRALDRQSTAGQPGKINQALDAFGNHMARGARNMSYAGGSLLRRTSNAVQDAVLGPKVDVTSQVLEEIPDPWGGEPTQVKRTVTQKGVRQGRNPIPRKGKAPKVDPMTGTPIKGVTGRVRAGAEDFISNVAAKTVAKTIANGDTAKIPDAVADLTKKVSAGATKGSLDEVGVKAKELGNQAKKVGMYGGGALLGAGALGLGTRAYLDSRERARQEQELELIRQEYLRR